MRVLLVAASQIPPGAPPGRYWLDGLVWIVPGSAATRWLLLADAAVVLLVATGGRRRPVLAGAVAMGLALLALNVAGLVLTDFFLALAAFHVLTGLVGLTTAGHARWAGAALLALTLSLGVFT